MNGRSLSTLSSFSAGAVSQTVTVAEAAPMQNTQSATEVVTVYKAPPAPTPGSSSKPKTPKAKPGTGSGIDVGGGSRSQAGGGPGGGGGGAGSTANLMIDAARESDAF